jgi:signal transduction histidine kinase
MDALLNQIFSFLTSEDGSVIYHLLQAWTIGIALYYAFSNWRSSEFPQVKRAMLGLGLLLLAKFFMFGISALGRENLVDLNEILPPLDRAFTLFSIVIITWLWAFPEPSRNADWATVLLVLFVVVASVFSLLTWAPQASLTKYNRTTDELLWQLASLVFLLLGAVILLVRRPNNYWMGLGMVALAALGHLAHLFTLVDEDYSGVVRWAYLAAFLLLVTLPQRFPTPFTMQEKPVAPKRLPDTPVPNRRRYSTDPKTFHAMLALAAESSPLKVSQSLTRAISQTMLADLCFLLYLTDNKNQLIIAGGYDLIREENLEGGNPTRAAIPMLTNAIQRGRPIRLPASSTSADIKGLGELLGLPNPGHLLSVPIVTPEKDVLGGLMLLSPYSNRLWTAEDQAFLMNIANSLVPIIQRSQRINRLEQDGEQNRLALEQARDRLLELEKRNQELLHQLENANVVQLPDTTALMAAQDESQRIITQLQQENAELRLGKNGHGSGNFEQIELELRSSLQEIARLQNQLADANLKAMEAEKVTGENKSNEQAEVIASISQELRQPMSSIIGYTDLLLGESVGILGALQRKFVERIKASTERIGSLIDDMIQLNTLEIGLADLKPEPIDLNLIIDNAMSYTSSQVREKNISLHLDLPKKLGRIHTDREALQQILVHLLQNAGAASPVEGTIRLKVETREEDGQGYVLVQVTDSGGGIPPEDLPRVFTRLYRADNVLIQGVGDTGVGLSIAKTLTEAQHGRIWVESEAGAGSTFSVLLPITQEDNLERSMASKGKS